jgi:hypothetical protein
VDWTNLIWIALLLVFVAPLGRHWLVQAARTRMIRRLEHKRGSRVIVLIHRQEILSATGRSTSS